MKRILIAGLILASAGSAWAQVTVSSPWARSTVPGQMGTGAFMTIVSKDGGRLVGAASPVAGVVELHEMAMDNNVMKMRAIPGLDLPAGREVQLKPGGYHVMLLDLKRSLKAGEKVQIELRLETRDGKRITQPVEVEVRSTPPGADAHKH
ncbi:MAG TPA: copper chaperone PCu(A)C [Burkholderiaceae bacterium]|nr:copper chaperone PCu(A)C [Burkholderiaceae bacterium]